MGGAAHPSERFFKADDACYGAQLLNVEGSNGIREPQRLDVRHSMVERCQEAASEAVARAGCIHRLHRERGGMMRSVISKQDTSRGAKFDDHFTGAEFAELRRGPCGIFEP